MQLTLTEENVNLSTAIVHLLSMKSEAESNAAGQASAATSVPNTVIIAPRVINSIASPTTSTGHAIVIIHAKQRNGHEFQIVYLM